MLEEKPSLFPEGLSVPRELQSEHKTACRMLTSGRSLVFVVRATRNDLEHFVEKRPPPRNAEATLLLDDASALFTNERVVSVDLAGEPHPALGDEFQRVGFGFALRQSH